MKNQTSEELRTEIVETLKLCRQDHLSNTLIERECICNTEGVTMCETDQAYYDRLWKMIQKYGCFSTNDTTILLERILQKMYVARNITLDEKVMHEILSDLDKYSNRFNDRNGESSEHNIRIQAWKTIRELKKKYLM